MIRFACPGCKSVLTGRDEHAGKSVKCPKCGQRVQAPRPAETTEHVRPRRQQTPVGKPSRRPFFAALATVALLLLAAMGGGVWLLTHFLHAEPEPTLATGETPPQPTPNPTLASTPTPKPPTPKPTEEKPAPADPNPPPNKPPVDNKPPLDKPPPLPPPVEEKKEIELSEDVPPELPFDIVDAVNAERAKAGREPIFLDAEASRGCQAQAEALARLGQPSRDRKGAEKQPLPHGRGSVIAEDAPLAAIDKDRKEPARRAALLEPRLQTFGAGFARNVKGRWFSVFDWTTGIDRAAPMEATAITTAIVYPAPAQQRVPLWFPGNETPDPLPEAKNKLAGYPITLIFPPQMSVTDTAAQLSNAKERDIEIWLSSPEKPANLQFAKTQQNTICLIAKKPLRPNTRYHVEASAKVNGKPWSAKWDFATISAGEIHYDMAGKLLRTLNGFRRRAGLKPVPFDVERSKACTAHARYLELNAPNNRALNWNEEKAELPGYTAEGAAIASHVSIQGGGGPVEAVTGLVDSLISRPQILDPRLRELSLGYTPFPLGGWLWVIELRRVPGREGDAKEYLYPAPDQKDVPLVYPPKEVPSPIPADSKDKLAGYAITAAFVRQVNIKGTTAKLVDAKGVAVDGWLSTPDKPAIADFDQRCLCFLPKTPLRPATRYTMTFTAEVNARSWEQTWSFTTRARPERFADDLDARIVEQVNAARKAAGLRPVRLDAELSRGCQAHARYLALHENSPAGQGMAVHREDAALTAATPEGASAAKKSVIAFVLDPQSCVAGWMATLYHRIPLLTPDLERIGVGHAAMLRGRWTCVVDCGNGRTPSPGTRPRGRKTP